MKKPIISLHNHMQFSFLDGVSDPQTWIKRCVELGMPGLALTDHGTCGGLLSFYREAYKTKKDASGNKVRAYPDFVPILGEEFYIVTNFAKESDKKTLNRHHITVMAKNLEGYQNLMRLSTKAYKFFHQRPRIDIPMLFEHSKGLIVTTGCLASFWSQLLVAGQYDEAVNLAKLFKKQFGNDFYAEIMPILVDCDWDRTERQFKPLGKNLQAIVNEGIVRLAQEVGIKMIPTLDAHYPMKEDKIVQDVLILNSFAGKDGWHFPGDTYYLQTSEEMLGHFKKWHPIITEKLFDEMTENTYEILNKCKDLQLPLYDFQMPVYKHEQHRLYEDGDDPVKLALKIIKTNNKIDITNAEYSDRLKKELSIIKRYNFLDYFLILEDIVYWAKTNGVVVGPSRGSAGGSLLAFALDITQVDPILFGCQFERFLNEDRLKGDKGAMPDIDMDFSDAEKVKRYIIEKFGEENVAAIGTLQRMSVKQAITDVSRIILPRAGYDFDYWSTKKLTEKLPAPNAGIGDHLKFYNCLKGTHEKTKEDAAYPEPNDILIDFLKQYEGTDIDKVISKIVGKARQVGVHPCAMVIADKPLTTTVPLLFNKKLQTWVTQYAMGDIEACGLVKFDILSLNTLNYLRDCTELVRKRHDIEIKLENLPLDDEAVFEAFSKADTDSVFQFNTDGMKSMLLKGKVTTFADLPAYNSLYRPGPLDMKTDVSYIKRKNGEEKIVYIHQFLESILQDTLGIILYQEQITEIVHKLGGFTRAEADTVRRLVSKSRGEELAQFEAKFLEYAVRKLEPKMTLKDASALWEQIVSFGGYGFNKSHAVGYSLIGYWCQYLKVHYPLEWWSAVLKNAKQDEIKHLYRQHSEKMDLPDINESKTDFFIASSDKIVMPISMVHGVGEKATESIIANQPYSNFKDFFNRVDKRVVNKGVVVNLILAGAFRQFSENPKDLLEEYYQVRKEPMPAEYAHINRGKMIELQQKSLPVIFYNYYEYFSDFFKDALPLDKVVDSSLPGHLVTTGGKIERVHRFVNRKGDQQAFVTLSNEDIEMSIVVFKEALMRYDKELEEGRIVLTKGVVNVYNNSKNLILEKLEVFPYDKLDKPSDGTEE